MKIGSAKPVALLTLIACVSNSPREPSPSASVPPSIPEKIAQEGPIVDPALAPLVRQVAEGHLWLGRSDALFWAPLDCLAPPPDPTFLSAAKSGEHARKVYHLFLQDPAAYAAETHTTLPAHADVGTHARDPVFTRPPSSGIQPGPWDVFRSTAQVLVKESWAPKECSRGDERIAATSGGKRFCAGEKGPLFIMVRPRSPASGTDDGWVYGTYVDGVVTAAGRVAACMNCHLHAPHGRLFGLPSSP
ncbi:MAG: hypothetical protein U0174_15705 [Polyangiaceae bacterium]